VSRELQGVFLTVTGVIVLRLAVSGQYLNYVKPAMQPYLVASALVVAALGIASFVLDGWLAGPGPVAGDQHAPGTGWLLGVPMAVILLVPPPALGSYAANRYGAAVPRPRSLTFAPLGSARVTALKVRDYATRATWGGGGTLTGRTVRLTGFVAPHADGGWYLSRLTLTCCAADARGAQVDVTGTPGDQPAEAWVQVTGQWQPSTDGDPAIAVPRIRAIRVTAIGRPENPYE
jgi:uncharacterized repeat protein (TIGR03943 family)